MKKSALVWGSTSFGYIFVVLSVLLALVLAACFNPSLAWAEDDAPSPDITPDEERATGYVPDGIPARSIYDANYRPKFMLQSREGIPASFSSVDAGYVTGAKDQGRFGTCWAFGVIAASEASLAAQGKADASSIDFSERHLAYFTFHEQNDPLGNLGGTYNVPGPHDGSGDAGDDTYLFCGANPFITFQTLANWKGLVDENAVSGTAGTNYINFQNLYEKAVSGGGRDNRDTMNKFYSDTAILGRHAFKQDEWHLSGVFEVSFEDANDVKKCLMKYGGAAVSINTQNSSWRYMNKDYYAYYNDTAKDSDHMVTIVGWDDNFDRTKFQKSNYQVGYGLPKNNGAWLVKNSWGNTWGKNGYFWISYEDVCLHQDGSKAWFFDYDEASKYNNNYQYDGSGAWYFNYIDSGGSIANVFTASENPDGEEMLEAVSFSVASDVNIDYSIQVYAQPADPSDPESGTLLTKEPTVGKTSYAGYYTVALNEAVPLVAGEQFVVVVTMSHADESRVGYDVDRTSDIYEWATFYHLSQANRSFERDSASSVWDDLSFVNYDDGDESYCTARIKAFTSYGSGEPHVHEYGAWEKLNDTQHQRVCIHNASHVQKENHKWGAGKVTTQPTTTEEGVRIYTCTVCKETKTESIPKLATWKRLSGPTALDTMGKITQEFGKASVAIVATNALGNEKNLNPKPAAGYKDALAGVALAGAYNAPIFSNSRGGLSDVTRSELRRMGMKTVYLIGTTNEVVAKVDKQIKDMGISVKRINANTASERAVAAAKQVKGRSDTVIIATQNNFKDALAISSYAYASKSPILYAETNKKLSSATVNYIKSAGFKKAIIVGGPVALPESTEKQLVSAGIAAGSISRLAGSNQYKTARVVAEWATGKLKNGTGGGTGLYQYASIKFQPTVKLSANKLGVARADDNAIGWKDALAGAALCGKNKSVVLLADAVNDGQAEAFVKANKAQISMGYVFGGTLAVPKATMDKLIAASKPDGIKSATTSTGNSGSLNNTQVFAM